MWTFEHSVETDAPPERIWSRWSDVSTWPSWDHGVTRVELAGPFAEGSDGTLHPVNTDPVPFTLVEVRPDVGFIDESLLPGAVLRFEHEVTPVSPSRSRVTHRVSIAGPAAAAYAETIGADLFNDLPQTVHRLVAQAEANPT